MGFRDLVLFNQAMLGRQCWRLLTEPNSLCARVLKGRYYPNCEFWNAPKPRSSLYTWRSILFGKKLVQHGVRWGIGDGAHIRILRDSWIPGIPPEHLKPLLPLNPQATVSSLMADDSRTWDEDVVTSFFETSVASKILQIPLSRHGEVWRAVKLVYPIHLLRKYFSTPKAWVLDFLARSDDRELVTLAVTVWHLWEARNGVRNGEKRKHPTSLAEQIKAYTEMILLHLFKPLTSHSRETLATTSRWSPTPVGSVVIHVDAALFSSSSRMGVGIVIRNHMGNFLAACSRLLDQVTVPEIAEALAIRTAVSLAKDEGWNNVIMVSDCLSVIQRIR
ncbi:hypothetical protein QYE76_056784 [Lolium multiflorum]|uniref:RNase H type-1 domain-containing protein n=1 Tax=Lolium multiflorum TaxID=4521 RepID=A0AAD8T3U3_LOLMU|nr:hypothetical protein QYE76_056784 [Lolium multiflorum]